MRYFTKDHEWVEQVSPTEVIVGITAYAVQQLGDIVFQQPEVQVGSTVAVGDTIAVVESVKAASDIFSPVAGQVVDVNMEDDLDKKIGSDPDNTWIAKIKVETFDPSNLLKEEITS